ncbi:MAG: biopolymer transporter ExbD [Bacteroidales bacterium]|jgi:biopolymer transport protein ExbD|nr:biopolymer transporter ExbD [Bacteroidales bacterium]
MARKKRKAPSINSSSSADLAFTLLIFFLVVTSMDTDEGLTRLLPRWTEEQTDQEIKKRNILNVLVNANNDLMIGDDFGKVEDLCEKAKNFIKAEGEFAGDRGPEYIQAKPDKYPELVQYFGADTKTPKNHVISLQSDYGTSYEMYIKVQNELVAAYNQLREELSQSKFGKPYDEEELSKEQMQAIKDYYPMNISEANAKY